MAIDEEETRVSSFADRPTVAVAAPITQLVLADANKAMNEMDVSDESDELDQAKANSDESLNNILEVVAKEQITKKKSIVVANKVCKKKRKQTKTAAAKSSTLSIQSIKSTSSGQSDKHLSLHLNSHGSISSELMDEDLNDTVDINKTPQSHITSEFSSAIVGGAADDVEIKNEQSKATDAFICAAIRDIDSLIIMRSSSNLSTHSIQSVKSSILSLQSDMSRQSDMASQSDMSHRSHMASQSDMSLHLNSHGSIAPEPMVEDVTVESVRQSLYNTLELVEKDENTNEKAILAEDLNKKRSAPVLKNDSKEHSQIKSGVSSVMISGETHVVQKKVDQSQATNVITDLGMRNIEQSSSATNSPLAAAKLTTKSIQSVKSTTLSCQSDMSRQSDLTCQSNISHKSDMSRQADMSLHLNSHSSIAPEPTVDEVTV